MPQDEASKYSRKGYHKGGKAMHTKENKAKPYKKSKSKRGFEGGGVTMTSNSRTKRPYSADTKAAMKSGMANKGYMMYTKHAKGAGRKK